MAVTKVGRPPSMTADDKELLLEYIAGGMSNANACRMMHIEPATFYLTLGRDAEFLERYQAAKAAAVDVHVDEAEEAAQEARKAENGTQVAGAKVFIDHKWRVASRLAPQRWGDKAQVHVTGQIEASDQEMAKRIAFLEALNGSQDGSEEE